jgi:molybdopterin-guanine dinucleotide biosynthesis protein A
MSNEIAVVILAGGEARRMGGVKALRVWRGRPLIDHMLTLAKSYSDCVAVAVKDAEQVGDAGVPLIFDAPLVAGPLGGLAAALNFARERGRRFALTLPCDMPLLPIDLAARLTAALSGQDLAAMPRSSGQIHPVCTLWRAEAGAQMEGYVAGGQSSLRGFAERIGMAIVEWPPTQPDPFTNANTPDDLAALERL